MSRDCEPCGALGRYVVRGTGRPTRVVCARHATGSLGSGKPTCREIVLLGSCSAYEPGESVQLVRTSDAYTELEPGTRGWVTSIDELGTVHVAWGSGSTLGMVPGLDEIERVSLREICQRCGRRFTERAWRRRHVVDDDDFFHASCCPACS